MTILVHKHSCLTVKTGVLSCFTSNVDGTPLTSTFFRVKMFFQKYCEGRKCGEGRQGDTHGFYFFFFLYYDNRPILISSRKEKFFLFDVN